jgi:hypothetical protein
LNGLHCNSLSIINTAKIRLKVEVEVERGKFTVYIMPVYYSPFTIDHSTYCGEKHKAKGERRGSPKF